jgi:ubiquinone/menaquinone biosynthesis C-methylase UbiE
MKVIHANIETYDDYYAKPEWWFRWRYDTQVKRKTCLALIRSMGMDWNGKSICDIGFGSGDLLFSFPRTCKLYGVESSSSALERIPALAEKKGYRKFQFFAAQQPFLIPLTDDFVDIVTASHVLEHVDDDLLCLREIWRVLKPGGILAIIIPINERFHDQKHMRKYTTVTFKNICKQTGLRFVHGFESEYLFYLVEKLYWRYKDIPWTLSANITRALFNIITAPLPFWCYQLSDTIYRRISKLPPRQSALLFVKNK